MNELVRTDKPDTELLIPMAIVDQTGKAYYRDLVPRLRVIQGYLKRQITREESKQADEAIELQLKSADEERVSPGNSTVFVVFGQDEDAVDTVFSLLREVELVPRDFADARRLTKHPMPYIGDVLETAF